MKLISNRKDIYNVTNNFYFIEAFSIQQSIMVSKKY